MPSIESITSTTELPSHQVHIRAVIQPLTLCNINVTVAFRAAPSPGPVTTDKVYCCGRRKTGQKEQWDGFNSTGIQAGKTVNLQGKTVMHNTKICLLTWPTVYTVSIITKKNKKTTQIYKWQQISAGLHNPWGNESDDVSCLNNSSFHLCLSFGFVMTALQQRHLSFDVRFCQISVKTEGDRRWGRKNWAPKQESTGYVEAGAGYATLRRCAKFSHSWNADQKGLAEACCSGKKSKWAMTADLATYFIRFPHSSFWTLSRNDCVLFS